MKDALVTYLLIPLLIAVGGLLSVLLGYATAWLKSKIKSKAADELIDRAHDDLLSLVHEQAQLLDSRRVANGGKLTAKDAADAKDAVLTKFRNLWGPDGVEALAKVLELPAEKLTAWLTSRLESAVRITPPKS